MDIKLPTPALQAAGAIVIVAVALFVYDRVQESRRERLQAELKKEFVSDLTAALQKALLPLNERVGLLEQDPTLPAVSIVTHNGLLPRGTGQIEIFNLTSTPAYADSSGTRVTGEIYNGTPRPFGLVAVALVALDAQGKVLARKPILLSAVAAGERRTFETTLDLPMSRFAAHRFELDAAR